MDTDITLEHSYYTTTFTLGSRVGAVSEHSPLTNVTRVRFPDSAS